MERPEKMVELSRLVELPTVELSGTDRLISFSTCACHRSRYMTDKKIFPLGARQLQMRKFYTETTR